MRSFSFGRLLKGDVQTGFIYNVSDTDNNDINGRHNSEYAPGYHCDIHIKNYTREDILLISSLRVEPTRISSIYSSDKYRIQETTNFVIVEIRMRENKPTKNGDTKTISSKKIEIRCPGHYLQNNSLFVEEFGIYITVDSRLNATRELVAQDARFPHAKDVSVPESSVKPNPICTFSDYEPLVKQCLERADKIKVKVGVRVDVDPFRVPDYIKSLRISVLDHNFSPYHCNRMEYDPTIDKDDFAIENHHWEKSEPIWGRFSDLHKQYNKAYFIDTKEHRTLGGVLCELAIFGDEESLRDYLFAHRCEEVYDELTKRIIDKNGNHALTKRIEELETLLEGRDTTICELRDQIKFEKDQTGVYKRIASAHDDTIKKLRQSYESANGFDAIMMDLENQRKALDLKQSEIDQNLIELEYKKHQIEVGHKSMLIKSVADILKSGWGILLSIIAIGTASMKVYNKLSSK